MSGQFGSDFFSSATPVSVILGVGEVEPRQLGHSRQVHQPRVGDLGAAEVEPPQVGQPLEMHQPRVGDLGLREDRAPAAWSAPPDAPAPRR